MVMKTYDNGPEDSQSGVWWVKSPVDPPAAACKVQSVIQVIQQFENIDKNFNREAE
jgi:hypothetical protein